MPKKANPRGPISRIDLKQAGNNLEFIHTLLQPDGSSTSYEIELSDQQAQWLLQELERYEWTTTLARS